MKQEIISFLSTCEDDIKNLATYLYENPEISYNEYNSSKYIGDLLKKYNFNVVCIFNFNILFNCTFNRKKTVEDGK